MNKEEKMIKFLHFHDPLLIKSSQRAEKPFQDRTAATVPATPEQIRSLATEFISTHPVDQILIHVLTVGVALLHPHDNYCKKTGRDLAASKMEEIPLKVVGVQITPTHIFVKLQKFKGMDLNLRLNKATNFSTVTGKLSWE